MKGLDPLDVVDSIEANETVWDRYQRLGSSISDLALRIPIATAKGLLKAIPKYKRELSEAIREEIILLVLEFENSLVFDIIKRYGDRGRAWLRNNIEASKMIFELEKTS